ncbi:hypothetical protein D1AOALGA4SA_11697 [Olavius algarvensis Delta 1 endosymbiont]|nr:hypothetical protein D1AOALGA4SA_11697 [Olavius algarvensis Delta 1 endosymbiont]
MSQSPQFGSMFSTTLSRVQIPGNRIVSIPSIRVNVFNKAKKSSPILTKKSLNPLNSGQCFQQADPG